MCSWLSFIPVQYFLDKLLLETHLDVREMLWYVDIDDAKATLAGPVHVRLDSISLEILSVRVAKGTTKQALTSHVLCNSSFWVLGSGLPINSGGP